MAHVAITVDGGLFSADLLERLGSRPDEVPGQRPADFSLDGARLSEEIQATFSDVQRQWQTFEGRRARHQGSATTLTRDLWMLPVLGLLGFDLTYQRAALQAGSANFTISHLAGDQEGAPPVHIVAHDQELDRRGDARQSPHALVQDYLNRSDCLWGVVTNGKKLRLLRDSKRFAKPTYVEFDLEAMVAGNLYSEFVVLFRLAQRTRLPRGTADAHESWLERYYQQGIAEGGRVRERLSEGVHQALLTLGSGFLAHPGSAQLRDAFGAGGIDETGYYRQLLRLVYRLLFLMVAEERRLLLVPDHENAARQRIYTDWYSITRLRQLAERRFTGDRHSDLFEGLKQTFLLFRDEKHAAMLGLTALDGELFGGGACRDLEAAACRNEDLLRAVFRLSRFQESPEGPRRRGTGVWQRVNYAGLDVEELGSVYEGLLEYRPYVDRERWTFDLVKGSQRKETASYYTPHPLIIELIDSALVPVMEERLAKATTPEEKERTLLGLKVVDPAAGSGHFLLAAARRIGRELARVRTGEPEPAPEAQRAAIRDVVRHCLYAVDRNPLAVDLCKVALWIEGHNTGHPLSFLDHHVKLGDSLIGVFDLKVLEKGIPDDAYKPLTGDDKQVARDLKRRNKREAEGQETLGLFGTQDLAAAEAGIARAARELEALEDDSPAAVHEKGRRYYEFRELHADFRRLRQACDLWTAAFFAKLEKPVPGAPERVPTTDHVLRAVRNQPGIQGVMKTALELAHEHRFFHWPIEFAGVFDNGGFDVALGNPPWRVSQISEEAFFSAHDKRIARLAGAERKQAIADLAVEQPNLWRAFQSALHGVAAMNVYLRASGRYSPPLEGKINAYSLFARVFLASTSPNGRSGFMVPTGIATDESNETFFASLFRKRQLVSLLSFHETRGWFKGTDERKPFCLLTLGAQKEATVFMFSIRKLSELDIPERKFTMNLEELNLFSPNTKMCPTFRTEVDAQITKKLYNTHPILKTDSASQDGDTWCVHSQQGLFNMTGASALFRQSSQMQSSGGCLEGMVWTHNATRFLPLYEGKMIWQFDHRYGTFEGLERRPENAPLGRPSVDQLRDPHWQVKPWYWVNEESVNSALDSENERSRWLIGWRDVTNAGAERTMIAAAIPCVGVGHTLPLLFVAAASDPALRCALLANLNAIPFDFVARQKIGGTHMTYGCLKQLPTLARSSYSAADLDFIVPRVLELTYTAWDMQPFARDLGYEGEPFRWDTERRAELRAQLDAYYAYLYGVSKKELRYILDPKDVMGEDYPSETFRVLKENEMRPPPRGYGEYRTQRLVLEAYDRFATDGTFDPARLVDEEYFPVVRDALRGAQDQLKKLVARANQEPRPVLFVEGASDAPIVEAAWRALFPGEPMPFTILAAGGTEQMKSLAGKGGALKMALDKTILALADNDGAGRTLSDASDFKKLKAGGIWSQLENGIWWCLLAPGKELRQVMERFEIPATNWPCTVEQCFSAALRRQAAADGAYAVARKLFPDLLVGLKDERTDPLWELDEADDAYWYVRSPHPDCKEPFAAWVADPARLTPGNFSGFGTLLTQLKELLAQGRANGRQPPQQRRLA
jgi:hypothetical protein